jgi:hypothetical protein
MRRRPPRKHDAVGWHEIGAASTTSPDTTSSTESPFRFRHGAPRRAPRLSAHIERDRVPADKFGTPAPKRLRGFYGPEPKLHGSFTGMTFSFHID